VSGAGSTIRITHCLCRRTSFSDLLPLARAGQWDLETLIAETGCGGQCGLCRPYLRRMLETGQTIFHELLTERS
jgi:bacterioferritin-associated ferredoxin